MKNNILIKRVATIDIGSNAIRLLISNVISLDGKLYHTKNSLHRVPVRLGQDSFLNSKVADSSKNKLIIQLNHLSSLWRPMRLMNI